MNPITKSRARNSLIILLSILIVDQVSKILVKTNMTLHESIEIFSWFKIMFIENNGMAYGMELGSKLLLSLMRFVLIAILVQYVLRELRNNSRWGYIVCLVMIVAGAVGNMIDGMFYGVVFDASTPHSWNRAKAILPFCMERWLTCFIFQSSTRYCQTGCPFTEENRMCSSVRCSILPTRR